VCSTQRVRCAQWDLHKIFNPESYPLYIFVVSKFGMPRHSALEYWCNCSENCLLLNDLKGSVLQCNCNCSQEKRSQLFYVSYLRNEDEYLRCMCPVGCCLQFTCISLAG
jgi:hypothetical protein